MAPTAAHLLGLHLQASDGVILADALRSPTAHEVLAQERVLDPLVRLQDALREQSAADLRQDALKGITSPPRARSSRNPALPGAGPAEADCLRQHGTEGQRFAIPAEANGQRVTCIDVGSR